MLRQKKETKRMKKLSALLLIMVLSLTALAGCGEEAPAYTAEEIYKEMTDKVDMPEAMMEQEASVEYFQNELGLDFSAYDNYVVTRSVNFLKAEVVIIIKTKDGNTTDAKKALEDYARNQAEVFSSYVPEEAKTAEAAVVKAKGNYVYLIMSSKVSELKKIAEKMIK